MRLLVVSEGKNELHPDQERGALTILIERLLIQPITVECLKSSDPQERVRVHRRKGIGGGMLKKAQSWLRYAADRGFDALAFVIDEDGFKDRLQQLNDAQEDLSIPLPRAIGLAIRAFDAWMLADEMALSTVLGRRVNRQRDMESLPNPKAVCKELCDDKIGLSDFYARIADKVNLHDLEARCPAGFAPFADRVRRLVDRNSPA